MAVEAGIPRAHVDLAVGALAPRLVGRGPASAHVALAAAGMVLLGGDRVHVDIDVGAGCLLEIEDIGGTVAYPSRGTPSTWTVEATLGANAVLLWRGLPFVVADDADVERRTAIVLERGARAVIRETLVLGRHGERGGRLVSESTVSDAEGPILAERLELHGCAPEPGVLGGCRVADTVVAVGFRPPTRPGDLVLAQPGALARHLGAHTHASPLDGVWSAWSDAAGGAGGDAAARAAEPAFSVGAP
ncbi:urease accessory protein [Microbacterium ulmi]|uniref:Urease accessory protein n=1 Tax=Microbacterium ulmi TaxID=179095 RepID=A0A7Y2M4S4_9MICO|nr:urease accessory protein [Microbacterium ulmi]